MSKFKPTIAAVALAMLAMCSPLSATITAIAGGPYTFTTDAGLHSNPFTIDASNSLNTNDENISFYWDLNNDGVYGASQDAIGPLVTVSSPTYYFALAGNVYVIGLQVTDGITSSYAFTTATSLGPIVVAPPSTSAVPEPSTWAMMLVAFAAIGFRLRRRERVQLQPA